MKNLIIGIILLLVVFNCKITQKKQPENITCKQAFELIQEHRNDSNFIILDLRTDNMYNEEHIENSICYDVFSENFDEWVNQFDRNKVYLLYCNVGHRSGIALNKMKELGFRNLYHLFKGIQEWKKQGYPTIKNIS